MKNKKGFTLIELLAVIAILAIILLIAVPQVLTVIGNSKVQSAKKSAQMAWTAADAYLANQTMVTGTVPTGNVTYAMYSPFISGAGSSVLATSADFTTSEGSVTAIAAGGLKISAGGTEYTCTGTTRSNISC